MSNNIGAGTATLYRRNEADDGYGTAMVVYDPLPELVKSRTENTDTNTGSEYARTRAGIKSIGALTFRVKTDDTEAANVEADWESGTERNYKYTVPSDATGATDGKEEVILACWVKEFKRIPSMEDETMIEFTLNVNGPGVDPV
tara:strand:- start:506 stop:937 length:432 start_codon:yes stop_codon:yes gene_type:complete